jgi:hypothetical protein
MQMQHRRNETENPKPRSTARTRRSKTEQEVGWANPFHAKENQTVKRNNQKRKETEKHLKKVPKTKTKNVNSD